MDMESVALLKDGLAKANSLYNRHIEQVITLDEESLTRLINIINSLNQEIEALTNQG